MYWTQCKYCVSIKYVSISTSCAYSCARARRWRTPFVDPPRAYTTVIAFSNACSNKEIVWFEWWSHMVDWAVSNCIYWSTGYFIWVSALQQSTWYSQYAFLACNEVDQSQYHSKRSLLLTFLVMICLVCVLASSSANTCSTTASQSLRFWSVSWLLRVTAGPEAVPNRRITDIKEWFRTSSEWRKTRLGTQQNSV